MEHFKRSSGQTKRPRKPIYRRPPPVAPDTLAPSHGALPTTIRVLAYGPGQFEEHEQPDLDQIAPLRQRFPVLWVDVVGLADVAAIERIGREFGLHALALEDAIHTHQRPKVEEYSDHLFLVLRMAPLETEQETDQLSLFVGNGFVITFQERPGDDLGMIRDRIRSARGRIREMGADYLAYTVLDACVDAYFPLLEKTGGDLEELEDLAVLNPDPAILERVYRNRRALLTLRRAVWPLRDAVAVLMRDESPCFSPETRVFLRDVYDHTIQLIDLLETYRELSSNLMDVYLSAMNNRLNEVMKILTIITTIFIPLSFIAGVYGMNFNPDASPWNMPELKARWGYPVVMAVMLLIALVEVWFFRKKGWIGEKRS